MAWAKDTSVKVGTGSPEGVVVAPVGRLYVDQSGPNGVVWQKVSGTGNTGWRVLNPPINDVAARLYLAENFT